jgi:putative pyruvate formate lyase activating enzyme
MTDLLKGLERCGVCPNFCGVDRLRGELGRCRVGPELRISSANLHFGEEPVLVGRGGSGTIFFTCCNLACVYCQNYDISQLDYGREITEGSLVQLMLDLQARGAENVNLVTPTHQAPQIFSALPKARARGLRLPIVYNCGGYENPEFLRQLDGLVDIYMPDCKYGDDEAAERYSGVKEYVRWSREALREMHRQAGDLELDDRGVARRGLLVRHLVLPGRLASSRRVIDFIAEEISRRTYFNIMDQYHPAYHAAEHKLLSRRVFRNEVEEVIAYAADRGLTRLLG